jgi:hypothetical protein
MVLFSGPARTGRAARLGLTALVLLALFSGSSPARAQIGAGIWGDFGDAPDTTNHHGIPMNAYPGVSGISARYPTVYDPNGPGPQGPWHRNPTGRSWLGATGVSIEANADLAPDGDGDTNIEPKVNRDGSADVELANDTFLAQSGIDLPQCGSTSFAYIVTGAPGVATHRDYVNVWFDWNRDGDWEDSFECTDANGAVATASEWAVRNQEVHVNPGANTVITPNFYSRHIGQVKRLWMRITLAEVEATDSSKDGSGPQGGFATGESSDSLLEPVAPAASSQSIHSMNTGGTYEPEVSFYDSY